MRYLKKFNEKFNPSQMVKITSTYFGGTLELIGHMNEKDGISYFIPQKDGFNWCPDDNSVPSWIKSSEEFFNKNKLLLIIVFTFLLPIVF